MGPGKGAARMREKGLLLQPDSARVLPKLEIVAEAGTGSLEEARSNLEGEDERRLS